MARLFGAMFVYRIAFVAAIGGFLFGFDLGMIGAANLYLRDQFHLSDALFGWRMMPETKGRTLEEIAESWKKP